jgi:hypothetical protein
MNKVYSILIKTIDKHSSFSSFMGEDELKGQVRNDNLLILKRFFDHFRIVFFQKKSMIFVLNSLKNVKKVKHLKWM